MAVVVVEGLPSAVVVADGSAVAVVAVVVVDRLPCAAVIVDGSAVAVVVIVKSRPNADSVVDRGAVVTVSADVVIRVVESLANSVVVVAARVDAAIVMVQAQGLMMGPLKPTFVVEMVDVVMAIMIMAVVILVVVLITILAMVIECEMTTKLTQIILTGSTGLCIAKLTARRSPTSREAPRRTEPVAEYLPCVWHLPLLVEPLEDQGHLMAKQRCGELLA